ncbi:SAM-dependent methyltransferase [Kitasatospora sp. Ki12]
MAYESMWETGGAVAAADLRPDIPHPARIYDYYLGRYFL